HYVSVPLSRCLFRCRGVTLPLTGSRTVMRASLRWPTTDVGLPQGERCPSKRTSLRASPLVTHHWAVRGVDDHVEEDGADLSEGLAVVRRARDGARRVLGGVDAEDVV